MTFERQLAAKWTCTAIHELPNWDNTTASLTLWTKNENNKNKKDTDVVTLVGKACAEVQGFEEMYRRLERRMNTHTTHARTAVPVRRHLDTQTHAPTHHARTYGRARETPPRHTNARTHTPRTHARPCP